MSQFKAQCAKSSVQAEREMVMFSYCVLRTWWLCMSLRALKSTLPGPLRSVAFAAGGQVSCQVICTDLVRQWQTDTNQPGSHSRPVLVKLLGLSASEYTFSINA